MTFPDKPTYRIEEVALYYGVTNRTVYLWTEHHLLDIVLTPSGQQRITKESLDKCRFTPKKKKDLPKNFR